MPNDYRSAVDARNLEQMGPAAGDASAASLADFLNKNVQAERDRRQQSSMQAQKAQLDKEAQARELSQAQDIVDSNAKAGVSVSAKVGNAAITQKEDSPLKYLMQSQQHGAKALSHAYDTYMKAFPEVQKRAQAASEGLEAVNDPNQVGSVGQAKTLMIKNLGMNRYNQQEGNALVPGNVSQVVHSIFNFTGDGSNPLSDIQRQALNTVFQGSLAISKKQHEMAKQNALGSYMNSGFADPAQAQQFKTTVGQDFDKQLDDMTQKYKAVPVNPGYQPAAPGSSAAPQPPSMFQKLKSMFSPPQQGQQPQTSGSAPPGQSQVPSFEEFKKRRAAGQL